jgi:hypothetical protein
MLRGMTPLDKCMQTLSSLVRLDDPGGVELMETAVAGLLKPPGRTVKPRSLRLMSSRRRFAVRGERRSSWGHILAYITQQRDELAGD